MVTGTSSSLALAASERFHDLLHGCLCGRLYDWLRHRLSLGGYKTLPDRLAVCRRAVCSEMTAFRQPHFLGLVLGSADRWVSEQTSSRSARERPRRISRGFRSSSGRQAAQFAGHLQQCACLRGIPRDCARVHVCVCLRVKIPKSFPAKSFELTKTNMQNLS